MGGLSGTRRCDSLHEPTECLNVGRVYYTSIMSTTDNNQLAEPSAEQDLQILPQMITAWKQVQSESNALNQQLREKKTRQKALEEVILRVMKKHQIGALDLKASNGRLLYKKHQKKGSLTQKILHDILSEHLNSEEAATKAIEFIDEKRGTKTSETLTFETL